MFLLGIAAGCGLAALGLWHLRRTWRVAGDGYRDWLAVGLLALITALFFWRLLFIPGVWMPAGGGDLAGFLYPTYHFAAESLKRGEIPLWNPYLYAGAPHVADIQSGVFYPLNLLVFLTAPEITFRLMELLSVLHFFIAGASMYLCLRFIQYPISNTLPLARLACLAGAVAFMFSDFFVIHFGNLNLIAVTAWLPLAFLGVHRALIDRRPGWALFGGGGLGMAALAGHAQPLQFILIVVSLYTLFRLVVERGRGRRWALGTVGLAGLSLAIGLGLAALSLLPAIELAGHTRRASLDYAAAAQYSLPARALMGLLVPDFFGRGVQGFWAPWPRVEAGYLGVLPLLLAGLAVGLARRRPMVRFLAILAVISLLLALGDGTPLHRWLYTLIPGFRHLRAPARFVVLMDFALAGLAAFGLDALVRSDTARRPQVMYTVLAIALVLGLTAAGAGYLLLVQMAPTLDRAAAATRGMAIFIGLLGASTTLIVAAIRRWLPATILWGLALALVTVDLVVLGSGVDVGRQDPTANFHRPRAVQFLRSDSSLYRIEVRPEAWGWWSADAALVHGFQDVGGIYNPLRLSDYLLFWESLTNRATRLYDFLNAKYIIAPPGYGLPADKFVPVLEDSDLTVYLNRDALPRVLMVYDAQIVGNQTAAFDAVHAADFDPTRTVILEENPRPAPQPSSHPAIQSPQPPRLAIADYWLNSLAVDVTTATPGYLVLSEVWYPGWRATVDGQPASLLRANYAFRAVPVPAGSHRVRLTFIPLSWHIGLSISLLTLLATAAGGAWLLAGRLGFRPAGLKREGWRRPAVSRGIAGRVVVLAILLVPVVAVGREPTTLPSPGLPAVGPIPYETPTPYRRPATPTSRKSSLRPTARPSSTLAKMRFPLAVQGGGTTPTPVRQTQSLAAAGPRCAGLVIRQAEGLVLNGQPYTFVGTNVSYLAKSTFPAPRMEPTIQALAQKGVDVIRVWAETDVDLDRIGHMLDLGQKYGVRFILTLEDYYFDKSESWFDSTYGMAYLPHIQRVVSRFRSHPAVLMWELMNEPNCSPEGQRRSCLDALHRWAQKSVATIRGLDPCRPISLGTIWIGGYNVREETQFERLHRIPGVDIISVHKPATAWYPREIRLAQRLHMPIFFGEIQQAALDKGCRPLPGKVEARAQLIAEDLKRAAEAGVDGYLLWQFAHAPIPDDNGNPLYYCGTLDYFLDDPVWDVLSGSALKFRPLTR